MLKRNLQAIYESNNRTREKFIPSEATNKIALNTDYVDWHSGISDLVCQTYSDKNLILGGRGDYKEGCNRGRYVIVKVRPSSKFARPIPKLEGYVTPRGGLYNGKVCYIWPPEYSSDLSMPFPMDEIFASSTVSPELRQKVYDLEWVLQHHGLSTESDPIISTYFNAVLVDPDNINFSIFNTEHIEAYDSVIRQKSPGIEFKSHPVLERRVTHYELPEITESKEKVNDILVRTPSSDEIMCLISAGKTAQLEQILKYTSDSIDSEIMFQTCVSNTLPFNRLNIYHLLDPTDESIYTYQHDYNEDLYRQAGTRKLTELVPYDEQEFELLFKGMRNKEVNRNRLSKDKPLRYYYDYDELLVDGDLLKVLQPNPKIQPKYVSINGIDFLSGDLTIFCNTLFYNIVEYQSRSTSQIEMPYLTINDLYLLRDYLKGRIMLGVLYRDLSTRGYEYLSGKNSLLEMSELYGVRYAIDSAFSFGEQPLWRFRLAAPKARIRRFINGPF